MQVKNQAEWDDWKAKNDDGYGAAIFRYAERWADLMEVKLAAGAKLEDVAEATSYEANTEGITGYMYGAAVAVLSKTWAHGEALRRWHNLATQIGSEGERANVNGGVLNPAILNVERR